MKMLAEAHRDVPGHADVLPSCGIPEDVNVIHEKQKPLGGGPRGL